MKFLFILLLFSSLFYLGSFWYLRYRLQFNLHTHHNNSKWEKTENFSPTTEFVTTSDNKKIAYWYVPASEPKAVVILVHGYSNPGGKTAMIDQVEYLQKAGYSTALLDLRGYGESEGNRISLGVHEWKDIEAVYDHLRSLPENKDKKIGFLGVSMGAVSSIITAGQTGKGDFVIASVPYSNFDSLFSVQLRHENLTPTIFLPIMKQAAKTEISQDYQEFTAAKNIAKISAKTGSEVPILLMAATQDDVVNGADAKTLYDLANQPKEYWEIESRHDIHYFHPTEFEEQVLQFLEKYVAGDDK